jgi:hypothetical protein
MKPIDKFNRPINKKTFEIISGIGDRLFRIGYGESSKKPNLFYFNDLEMTFFADFRGTDVVPIWEDPRPLLYWKKNKEIDNKEIIQRIVEHYGLLGSVHVETRRSFYENVEPDSYTNENKYNFEDCIHDKYKIPYFLMDLDYQSLQRYRLTGKEEYYNELEYDSQDGICKFCRKEFDSDGFFCSEECRVKYIKRLIAIIIYNVPRCDICHSLILNHGGITTDDYTYLSKSAFEEFYQYINLKAKEGFHKYHKSYFPVIILNVCDDCYTDIKHNKYPELKPPKGDRKKFLQNTRDNVKL